MTTRLRFGYNRGIPDGVETAWGCRAIVNQDGHVDVVYDRQDAYGPDDERAALLGYLNERVEGAWRDTASAMLTSGTIDTRRAAEHVLYEDNVVSIVGNTNASAGYLYVAAFVKPGASLKRYIAKRMPIPAERWEKVYGWDWVDAVKMDGTSEEVRLFAVEGFERREIEHPRGGGQFEFGYGGSGPHETARYIALDAVGATEASPIGLRELVPEVFGCGHDARSVTVYAADVAARAAMGVRA